MTLLNRLGVFIVFCLLSVSVWADSLMIPNAFSAGATAVAAQVNANFTAVKSAVDDNDARVTDLETENAALIARIEALEAYVAQLQTAMSLGTDNQGNTAVVFSGVNVHINNGLGTSDSINGTGNLIVGYDEVRTTIGGQICSNGFYDNEPDCTSNGGSWQINHKSGSHNVVIGPKHNYSDAAGLVAGSNNSITQRSAAVLAGTDNIARGEESIVVGGHANFASGRGSSISGGSDNRTTGQYSAVSGGNFNMATATDATVGGGGGRTASNPTSWAAGSLSEAF